MQQLKNYGDERQSAGCVHCGNATETRDHTPAKIFLDEPFPENLPIVFACGACNNSASDDEAYLPCLIDCALTGTTGDHAARRLKITRVLQHQVGLHARLSKSAEDVGGVLRWSPELNRVHAVVVKIARGLALFELNEPRREQPDSVEVSPLCELKGMQTAAFERIEPAKIWPEVGSRAMQRLLVEQGVPPGWIQLQEGRFRFGLNWDEGGVMVRMVFSEYLAAEVIWSD